MTEGSAPASPKSGTTGSAPGQSRAVVPFEIGVPEQPTPLEVGVPPSPAPIVIGVPAVPTPGPEPASGPPVERVAGGPDVESEPPQVQAGLEPEPPPVLAEPEPPPVVAEPEPPPVVAEPEPPAAPPKAAPAAASASVPPPAPDPPPPAEEGAPAWVMTFGDLMSLLLTFFILLYSMSSVETEKFKAVSRSLAEAFGEDPGAILPEDGGPVEGAENPSMESPVEVVADAALDVIAARLQQFVAENELQDQILITKNELGVFLRIRDAALFGSGSASIQETAVQIVDKLGDILTAIQVPVIVSGHTDNVAIRSPIFPSNWELSAARAAGVARALVSRGYLASNLTVEAYGEYRPIASNDTPEGRSRNRRVELYYARQTVVDELEGNAAAEASGDAAPGEDAAAATDAPAG